MIRVLIADDHPIVREGLKRIFDRDGGIEVVGEARTGQEVLNKLRRTPADVVVLDIRMPGKSFLDTLGDIRARFPDTRVLIISMHAEREYILRAFKLGAAGYLTKESLSEEVVSALKQIHRGGRYVAPGIAEKLVLMLDEDVEVPPHEKLSDREFQVMRLIAQGVPTREIAASLFISDNTVATYRSRILSKMKLTSSADLIIYAVRNNLID